MKKIIIPAIALVLAIGSSAFTAKQTTSNFFKYNGPAARTSTDIQSRSNYIALDADPCGAETNVCGVTLNTAKTVGQLPDATEFSAQAANLWNSQLAHSPQNAAISMEE